MRCTKKKDKWVFEKEGVFFALTESQLLEMRIIIDEVLAENMEPLGAEFQKVLDGNIEELYET